VAFGSRSPRRRLECLIVATIVNVVFAASTALPRMTGSFKARQVADCSGTFSAIVTRF